MDNSPAPEARYTYTKTGLAKIFDEWKKRYEANPDEFDLNVEDCGMKCAEYFVELGNELDKKIRSYKD